MLRRRLVHPRDADAWRAAFVDVEGGGCRQLVVSAADETWRVILCWGSRDRRIDVNQHGIPASLVDLHVRAGVTSEDPHFRQLNIASFGHRLVRYDPLTGASPGRLSGGRFVARLSDRSTRTRSTEIWVP